jgi:hypothetical protein
VTQPGNGPRPSRGKRGAAHRWRESWLLSALRALRGNDRRAYDILATLLHFSLRGEARILDAIHVLVDFAARARRRSKRLRMTIERRGRDAIRIMIEVDPDQAPAELARYAQGAR